MVTTKRSTGAAVTLSSPERELLRQLVERYRNSLDILVEPRHNELLRTSTRLIKRLS